MTLPNFDILSLHFDVEEVEDEDLDGNLGDTNGNTGRVRIRKSLSPSLKRETVLHELIHAALAASGHGTLIVHMKDEEHLVSVLAPVLLHTLRENPDLAAYLLDSRGPAVDQPLAADPGGGAVAAPGGEVSALPALPGGGTA